MRAERARSIYVSALIATALGAALLVGVFVLGGGCSGPATVAPTSTATRTPAPPATETAVPPTATDTPTATPSPTVTTEPPTSTREPTATEMLSPTPSATATEASLSVATGALTATEPVSVPGGGTLAPSAPVPGLGSAFENRVWVGLYGTPGSRGLGILGTASATETVAMAVQQALPYQAVASGTQVVAFFHMVVTIADAHPGPDSDYVHRVTTSTIQEWIDVARANGLYSVLDIQPGHSPITEELAFVEPFVRQPGVHLAVDPEFMMLDGSVPGRRIGSMTGDLVNVVQAWLNGVAEATGERKVLVIHQFDDRMFSGKEALLDYPLVDLVWDADGFGGPGPKIADFRQYAAEPGFEFGGFKLFYDYDTPLMTPAEVMALEPRPAFVVYQ